MARTLCQVTSVPYSRRAHLHVVFRQVDTNIYGLVRFLKGNVRRSGTGCFASKLAVVSISVADLGLMLRRLRMREKALKLILLSGATPWMDASTASDTATAGCQGWSNHQWIVLSAKTCGDRLRHVIPRSQVHAERNQNGSGCQCGCQVCLSMRCTVCFPAFAGPRVFC